MSWDSDLTGTALAIACCNEQIIRVIAGPGTGKSFALQRLVARLLEVDRINPRRILAVTFTRNAAANLIEDLNNLGIDGCERIYSGTLHSYCFRLLSEQNVFEYLERVARPLLTFNKSGVAQFECQPMLEDIAHLRPFGTKRDMTRRIRAFESAWARLQHEEPGWPIDAIDLQFQEALLEWLRFHQAILIGELVPEALRFLRNNPEAPDLHAFDYVIVDEYQDLNKAEQILLDYLSCNGRLTIVGDVDQSIYSFRFANPEGIVGFSQRHPQTHDEPLQECYRCPRSVVEIADNLIKHNYPHAIGTRLLPTPDKPMGEMHIIQWETPEQEAQGLALYVNELITCRGYAPGEVIVMSPRRLLGYGIRDALRNLDIPTHSFYNEESLETIEAQEAFALLTLLVRPEDRVALRYWVGLGSPSWRRGEYDRIRTHCEMSGLSTRAVLGQMIEGSLTIDRTNAIRERYLELIRVLNELAVLDCTDLVDCLFPEEANWAAPMRETALTLLESVSDPESLWDALRFQITQPEMPKGGNYVRVMSLHKAKGLTTRVAIVTSCIEGLVPTIDSRHTPNEARENLMEQRRLLYVSITRCRETLVLSSILNMPAELAYRIGARIRGRRGVCSTFASRFIDELGPSAPASVSGNDWLNSGFN